MQYIHYYPKENVEAFALCRREKIITSKKLYFIQARQVKLRTENTKQNSDNLFQDVFVYLNWNDLPIIKLVLPRRRWRGKKAWWASSLLLVARPRIAI